MSWPLSKLKTVTCLSMLALVSALLVLVATNSPAFAATGTGPATANQAALSAKAGSCTSNFFGFVPWYGYFPDSDFQTVTDPTTGQIIDSCRINLSLVNSGNGTVNLNNLNSIWLIALAIFEDLLLIAGMVAFAFVVYGGIRYITSQGEPENTKAALGTIINALVGAAIAAIAAVTISFIGNKLG